MERKSWSSVILTEVRIFRKSGVVDFVRSEGTPLAPSRAQLMPTAHITACILSRIDAKNQTEGEGYEDGHGQLMD